MLNEGHTLVEVSESLLLKSASSKISRKELYQIAQFFLLAGLHKDFFRQFPRRFFEKELITWPQFVEILIQNKIKISNRVIQAIYEGCDETKSLKHLALNKKWLTYDIRFQKIRQNLWEKKVENLEKMRQNLIQKIEFLKNHRLIEDEKKAYLKYMEVFPEDDSIQQLYEDFKERQARDLINKKIEQKKVKEISITTSEYVDIEEARLAQRLLDEVMKMVQSQPHLAYNFSIMFVFFEMFDLALKLLEFAPKNPSSLWLKMELLFLNEDYFKLLTEAELLERDSQFENIEDSLALIYYKARAYKFLNQKSQAAELLNSILKIRPHYRSAQTLLSEILEEGQ